MSPIRSSVVAMVLVGAACGDGTPPHVVLMDAPADSFVPDAFVTPPGTISIRSFGDAPLALAWRERGGAWQALATNAKTFRVTGSAYELLAVCQSGTFYDVAITAALVSDGTTVSQPCFAFSAGGPPATVAVSGSMKQAGQIVLGVNASSATAPWTFSLDVPTGPHELIAFDGARWLIRNGLTITTATTVPDVDTVADGVASHDIAYALGGVLGDDTASTEVDWLTSDEYAYVTLAGTTAKLPDDTLVDADDFVFATVTIDGGAAGVRTLEDFYTVGSTPATAYTLMPRLSGVTFASSTASWTALPAGDAELRLDTTTVRHRISASAGYLGSATSLAIDLTGVPGWMATWDLDAASAGKTLTVSSSSGNAYLSTSISGQ